MSQARAGPSHSRFSEQVYCRNQSDKNLVCRLEQDQGILDSLSKQLLVGLDDPQGDHSPDRLYKCVLYRALRKKILLDCAERCRYFAAESERWGHVLGSVVMEVTEQSHPIHPFGGDGEPLRADTIPM